MKLLFRLNKNDSSLQSTQIEQLELDKLFKKINRTNTHFGTQYLYYLITQLRDTLRIENETEYIRKVDRVKKLLSGFNRHRHLTFIGFLVGEKKPFSIVKNLNIKLYCTLALINFFCFFLIYFTPSALIPFILLSFLNSTIYYSKKLSFFYVRDTVLTANDIYRLLQKLNKENIKIPSFKSFKNDSRLIRYLYAEVNPFLNEMAVIFFLIEAIKSIFLLDLFFANLLFNRIEKHKRQLLELYYLIAKIDTYISVYELKEELNGQICKPNYVKSDNCFIRANQLFNPLIKECRPINFKLENSSMVITGHNASGKSSLIKTIVTNYIIGKTLGFCFSKDFTTSFESVYFLIGSSDHTSKGQSLYQYEIKKLEEIVNNTEGSSKKNLIVFDEIIRGTNEADREKITFSISKYLSQLKNNSIIITTHNISLAKRLVSENLKSYYFKTSFDKITGLVTFEYELKQGLEETTNAKELLKNYQFPASVIENIN